MRVRNRCELFRAETIYTFLPTIAHDVGYFRYVSISVGVGLCASIDARRVHVAIVQPWVGGRIAEFVSGDSTVATVDEFVPIVVSMS